MFGTKQKFKLFVKRKSLSIKSNSLIIFLKAINKVELEFKLISQRRDERLHNLARSVT